MACRFGAKVSIGWTDSICYNKARADFAENFSKELASGKTVKLALRNATNDYSYRSGSNVEKWAVYCSDKNKYDKVSLMLSSVGEMAECTRGNETASRNLLESYRESIQIQGEDLAGETADVLRKIDSSFDMSDYHAYVYKHNDGSTTVVFVRVVGGFETDFEYRVGLEGNKLVSVLDHTKGLTADLEAHIFAASSQLGVLPQDGCVRGTEASEQTEALSEALQLAREQIQFVPDKVAGEQRYNYFYDVELDRPFIMVFTEYNSAEPGMNGTDYFEYDLTGQEEIS